MRRTIAFSAAIVIACVVAPTTHAAAQGAPRSTRVLIVYTWAPESPMAWRFIERFRTTVRRELPAPVEFYEEHLDLDRFETPAQWPLLGRYLRQKYKDSRIDLIVPLGPVALPFTTQELHGLFPNATVVFGMALRHDVRVGDLSPRMTGRFIPVSAAATVRMARRLQPDAEQVVVVAGSAPVDSAVIREALSDLGPLRDSLRVVVRQGLPLDGLLEELRRLPPRTIVFVALFRRDGRGQVYVPVEMLPTISRASRAPVYGHVDHTVGTGIVGGAMLRLDDEARRTGRLALQVLRRQPGERIPPVEVGTATFIADWRQLRGWGMDERRLPPGTEVSFRTPSTWERYGHVILGVLGIIAAEAFLIAWLLVERRRRRRAQAALEEQARYERTIAELTNDAVRYAADDAPRALEDALSRIAEYAAADTAVLVQYPDSPSRQATRVDWTRETEPGNGDDADFGGNGSSPGKPGPGPLRGARLDLPLVVGGKAVGGVELYRSHGGEWPAQFIARLGPVAELMAAAIARSNAARAADEASRQLAHLGRVTAVGELAVAISHELRQPLTAIRSNAEVGVHLLEGPAPNVDEARQVFGEIVADDMRATEVIEQVRLLLRKQEPGMTAVDLNEVCRQAALLLGRDASTRGVQLILELRADPPTVMANAAEMQQVVLNLVLNALDALTTHGGRREVVIGTSTGPKSVELFVRDTGPGLTPEVQARLFESFFSTKPHGLGVGLSIVRSIVERFRGRVLAENPREGGAAVRVTLPAAGHALDMPGRAQSPPPLGASASLP